MSFARLAACGSLAALGAFSASFHASTQFAETKKKKQHICVKERKFVKNCGDLMVFSGTAHPQLAQSVALNLGTEVQPATIGRFNDGEAACKIDTSVRGADVYIIQPTSPQVSDNLMELLLMISALKNASARHVTAIVPYFGFMREDGTSSPMRLSTTKSPRAGSVEDDHESAPQISHRSSNLAMADIARMFEVVGCDRVVTFDLHASGQSSAEGFFNIQIENLTSGKDVVRQITELLQLKQQSEELIVVAPHSSCFSKAKKIQRHLKSATENDTVGLALVVRRPTSAGEDVLVDLVGDVKGKNVLIVEDVVDSGRSMRRAARAAREAGAKHIWGFASHAVLPNDAGTRLEESPLEKILVLNTVPLSAETKAQCSKLLVIDVAPQISRLVMDLHMKEDKSSVEDRGN